MWSWLTPASERGPVNPSSTGDLLVLGRRVGLPRLLLGPPDPGKLGVGPLSVRFIIIKFNYYNFLRGT